MIVGDWHLQSFAPDVRDYGEAVSKANLPSFSFKAGTVSLSLQTNRGLIIFRSRGISLKVGLVCAFHVPSQSCSPT